MHKKIVSDHPSCNISDNVVKHCLFPNVVIANVDCNLSTDYGQALLGALMK